MSITYCLVILLFLFILSLQACNARHLGVLLVKSPYEDLRFSNMEEEEKKRIAEEIRVAAKVMESRSNVVVEANLQEGNEMSKITKKDKKRKSLGDVGVKELTWKVPKKKMGEKQPGFNLDYSPPKTHPPSHNR